MQVHVNYNCGAHSRALIHIDCGGDVNLKKMDYIPFLSMVSGVAHIALATLALSLISFAIMADICTLGRFQLTERVTTFTVEQITRGSLCFIPFIGNWILYVIDQEAQQR